MTQVEMQLTVRGTVEDFDQARFKSSLGAYLEVSPASISLKVSAASVNVKATISFDDASAAGSVVDTLQGLASNLIAFSAAVGVTVEGATDPAVSQVVILAPSLPPASHLPPSTSPLPPSPSLPPSPPSPRPPSPSPPPPLPPPLSPSPPPPRPSPLLPPTPPTTPLLPPTLPTTGQFQTLDDGEEQFVESGGEAALSTGAIAGIVVAMLFLVAALAVVMLLKSRRQKKRAAIRQTTSGPNPGSISVMKHGLASSSTSDPKPSNGAQLLLNPQLLDPNAAGDAESPPQLAGTLHKRSHTTGMYTKVKVSQSFTCYLQLFLPTRAHLQELTTYHPPITTRYLRPIILLTTHYSLLTTHHSLCMSLLSRLTLRALLYTYTAR